MSNLTVLILAAGKGTRMKSKKAKVLHEVAGRPMLDFVVRTAKKVSDDICVVVGHQASDVRSAVKGVEFVDQREQLGTGDAVLAARESLLQKGGDLLVLPGDVTLVREETLRNLVDHHNGGQYKGSVLTAKVNDPDGYGRIVRNSSGGVECITEHRDASPEILEICEINSGIYVFDVPLLFNTLKNVKTDNNQDEYYLTDVVAQLVGQKHSVGVFEVSDPSETYGINSREELARATTIVRRRKCGELMDEGVSIIDPGTTWIDTNVKIQADSVIHPSVCIEGDSVLGSDVTIRSFSRLTNSRIGDRSTILEGCIINNSEVSEDVEVGPYAHLRTGVVLQEKVKVGNFVEIKKSNLGSGTKSMHLAYLGDAEIGNDVNIGAGTITCNYDGVDKNPTVIEDGAFIGSDTQLIAPVTIGKDAYVAAGSSITDDVPSESLAVARGRQTVKKSWARQRKKKNKK